MRERERACACMFLCVTLLLSPYNPPSLTPHHGGTQPSPTFPNLPQVGAFIAGLSLAGTTVAEMTAERMEPLGDVFGGMLFAAMGMMIDPRFFMREFRTILGMVIQVCIWKVVIISSVVKGFGYSTTTGLLSALLLADISELSLVFMAKAHGAGDLVQRRTYLLFLCTSIATLLVAPFIHRFIPTRTWVGDGIPGGARIEMSALRRNSNMHASPSPSAAGPTAHNLEALESNAAQDGGTPGVEDNRPKRRLKDAST